MNKKDFKSIIKKLLSDFPGFRVQGQMLFIYPVEHTLRAIYLEDSTTNSRSFFVWAFFLPLYVPMQQLSFNLGKRLHGTEGERWNADSPTLIADLSATVKSEALPFLSCVKSPLDLVKAVMPLHKFQDPYVQQAVAYAFARAGYVEEAKTALNKLMHSLDVNVPWHREIADRAKRLATKLSANPSDALQQLKKWEAESIFNLQIEDPNWNSVKTGLD